MSTTDLAQQVADLTTATTKLTEEVVGQKDRLTAAADTATSKASESTGSASAAASSASSAANSVTLAANEVTKAEQQVDLAEAEVAKAKEVSGLETVEQAVDLALSEFAGIMTESESRAIHKQNEQKFAASGMVYTGKDISGSANITNVNEGMATSPTTASWANQIMLGAVDDANTRGTSDTLFPVCHIAGAVMSVLGIARKDGWLGDGNHAFIELPQASDGTEVNDSTGDCRGSGKSNLNLKTDIDPKYGNAPTGTDAQVLREGVGRAFEGSVKNGDLRLGDNGDWAKSGAISITSAGAQFTGAGQADQISQAGALKPSTTYTISMTITGTAEQLRVYAGTYINTSANYHDLINKTGVQAFTFTTAPDATAGYFGLRDFHIPDGNSFVVSNISVVESTEEVVTCPKDLVMFEYFEEELTGRQEVMECIQSLSTTFGDTDVPTVLSTRPLSYFQQYTGQFPDPDLQNDRYRCVVWSDLTDEQKRKVAAYMGERLFMGVNGLPVNGRLRARTIRGAGNGDWSNINAVSSDAAITYLQFSPKVVVSPQGARDVAPALNGSYPVYTSTTEGVDLHPSTSKGVFGAVKSQNTSDDQSAYKGRCFAYVVATVPRANQGAYHPDLNPYGCARIYTPSVGNLYWYDSRATELATSADCFGKVTSDGTVVNAQTGHIGSASGHPDDIYYDGINAGGLNGVIDYRLSAYPMDTKEEASKAFGKVVNGTYRGLEKLVWTVPVDNGFWLTSPHSSHTRKWRRTSGEFAVYIDPVQFNIELGDWITVHDQTINALASFKVNSLSTASGWVRTDAPNSVIWRSGTFPVGDGVLSTAVYLMHEKEINLSVSGEFSTQVIFGDPANILLTDGLKGGWLGTWGGLSNPSGNQELTRKAVSTVGARTFTDDNGITWSNSSLTINTTLNTGSMAYGSSARIWVAEYKAFASQTVQSTNKPVLNGSEGLGDVWAHNGTYLTDWGNLLLESMLGKVGVSGAGSGYFQYSTKLDAAPLHGDGDLYSTALPTHAGLNITSNSGNSPAVKALWYMTSDNGQVGLNFAYNELAYGNPTIIDKTGSDTSTTVVGQIYRITSGRFAGYRLYCTEASGAAMDASEWFIKGNEVWYNETRQHFLIWGGSWGDDSTVRIIDGQGTFVNLNGDTCLYGSNELALPMGWTSNHARVGTQIEGVDL